MFNKTIYIGGVARSGTSWIGQIINSCLNVRYRFQPFFSYEFKNVISEESSEKEITDLFKNIYETNSLFLTQEDKVKKGIYPNFKKENENILVFKENRYQSFIEPILRKVPSTFFVGVIRNPNATLYSWTQNEKEFPLGSDIIKEWRFGNCKNTGNEDYFGYYKWKEVANLYLDLKEKYPDRVYLIHYDSFIKNLNFEVKMLYDFLGLNIDVQTYNFINTSSKRNDTSYYSVFKGAKNKNEWKEKLPQYIIDEINQDLKSTRLEKFLI